MKTRFATRLGAVLLLAGAPPGCREKPVDQGALLTARTVGLVDLQRGRLAEAEQQFRHVIALAPRDPQGHANLGLTYLRGGPPRYGDAEAQFERARRLDARNPDIALMLARLYSLTGRAAQARRTLATVEPSPRVLYALAELERESGDSGGGASRHYADLLRQIVEKAPSNLAVQLKLAHTLLQLGEADSTVRYLEDVRRLRPQPPREAQPHLAAALQALRAGRLSDGRVALGRFLQLMEVTAPYQASLDQVIWTEGPLVGRAELAFNPASLITMRGIAPAPSAGLVRFTDVTGESGLPDLGVSPTALALGDVDGDGADNLLVAAIDRDGRPIVQLFAMRGGFVTELSEKTPLPLPVAPVFATFADYDNDGWLDLFAIGGGADGRGYLLHNLEGQRFDDVSHAAGVGDVNGARRARFVDLDHDGDLDLLLVGGGSLGAYRNNLDGTFALFPNAAGIVRGGSDAAFGDLDDDGRADVFVASETGGDALFLGEAVRGFVASDAGLGVGPRSSAVAIGDYDNDGALDVFVTGPPPILWRNRGTGSFTRDTRSAAALATLVRGVRDAAFLDYDNDGWLDLIVAGSAGASLLHNDGRGRFENRSGVLPPALHHDSIGALLIADMDGDGDQDILAGTRTGLHLLRNDGGNSRLGMNVQLTALGTGSGKNNTFGIGARLEVRAGELYQTRVVTGRVTQFGLGSHFKADVLRVQWTNGVPQTIYFPGTDADVLELEALKGSCAFLYTWDGKQFRFITDVMWRSALGMPLGVMGGQETGVGSRGAMTYAPAGASLEYVRIPGEALKPRNGRYVIQVTEELWETAYVDQLRLLTVDHPDSVEVFVDERFPPMARGGGDAQLRLFQAVRRRPPLSAVDGRGADVLADLREHDYRYVSNLTPRRYQGLTEPHALILDLDEDAGKAGTFLFLRGWIYPSDASINVALAQQQLLRADVPVLEVRDARGRWVSPRGRGAIGFPAGKDKTVVIDLAGLFPTRDHHVRLRTSMQIHWDQAFVAKGIGGQEQGAGNARVTILTPVSGNLHYRGFSRMYRRGGRYGPHWFAYEDVTRESPWRPIAGAATRFGDVRPLLERADDQYVVMAPGDETTVEFDASRVTVPRGWKRTFLLYSDGWIKDSDLNTAYGNTIEPLPYHAIRSYPYAPGDAYPADSARQRYLREYNTRIIRRR